MLLDKAYLQPCDIELLEKAVTNLRDRLLVRILFHLGCRISEALGLEVKDVDLERGTVTIQHLKALIKLKCSKCGSNLGRSHSFCPRCGVGIEKSLARELERKRVRNLPVDVGTVRMLKDYIERGEPVRKGDRLMLFGINRHRAWQVVKECGQRAGLPRLVNPETGKLHSVSPHKLRDAFAIHAIKRNDTGDGLRLLQEHLGHQSFNTRARYRKVAGEELRAWYEKLWTEDNPPGIGPRETKHG